MFDSEGDWLERLDEYVGLFREDFRRRDQIRWAGVYLQGLLREGSSKTIGKVAARVTLPPELVADDVAQALQNFVNQSPWDERKLWRRHRQLHAARAGEAEGVFVLEDLAFVKQGRHSVGVQRQYSGVLGRKTNCQIAVALYHLGPAGVCPLAVRLYLPRSWVQSPARLEAAGVPEEYRGPQTRGSVAVELLDLARSEGWHPPAVVVGNGLGTDLAFREALAGRDLHYLIEAPAEVTPTAGERAWPFPGRVVLTNAPADLREARLRQLGQSQELLPRVRQLLMDDLGLDHFEGRSWRGFHHHACLVGLAYSFRALKPEAARYSSSSML
jgi:SRSO17 transposase